MGRKSLLSVEGRIRRELPGLTEERAGELGRIVECLVAALHPDRIYAFGSHVRGDSEPDSDLDLLIVVPSATEPAHRLAQAAYHALPAHSLPVDILVMSREEFESRSRAASSLSATVLREGRALYAA